MLSKKTLHIIVHASILMLALVFGLRASSPSYAQSHQDSSITIPYSGNLTNAEGQPVAAGTYEFSFVLYRSENEGEALWKETQAIITMQNGSFTALLGGINPLPKAVLDLATGWLEIGVRGPDETSFTMLSPRQAVSLAAPEAPVAASSCAHDHWNETWSGDGIGLHLISNNDTAVWAESYDGWAGVDGRNYSSGVGVYGESTSYMGIIGKSLSSGGLWNSVGIKGYTEITTGDTTGVWGEVASGGNAGTRSHGVVGYATKSTGYTYGVWGQSESSTGTGVYGQANSDLCATQSCFGVYGVSTRGSGVYGISLHGYGVLGKSTNSTGVYGFSTNSRGVYGEGPLGVVGFSASNIGVLASSSTGVGLRASSEGGNSIEAYGSSSSDREFYVSNTGEVYADGAFHPGGADLAEILPAVAGLEPGDVLVIGEDGLLTRCTAAYQPTVVGVYSTQPGFLGGSADGVDLTGQVPLAVIGVVPVKVSAENGSIRPGDLLVASSTPGYAMRAGDNPPAGTIIGKALAFLLEGTGVIKILVMLQ